MRSSRAALVEHIEGTKAAETAFDFNASKKETGNLANNIKNKMMTKLPQIDFPVDLLPIWLKDIDEYRKQCEIEISLYLEISSMARELSDNRERRKAKTIADQFKGKNRHNLVIAFDSTILTLDYIHTIIKKDYPEVTSHVVTGSAHKEKILEKFELGSKVENTVALCSDSMSEGVNLQQASVVVLMDMPSVLRIAEQRIGRIERIDSPHKEVDVYWPDDSDDFALKADLKLIRTSVITENLIGSNLDIPEEFMDKYRKKALKTPEIITAFHSFHEQDETEIDLHDAYKPLYDLFEGKGKLISKDDFEYFKGLDSSIRCKLSVGLSQKAWLFLALKRDKINPPRWYFIDNYENVYSDIPLICEHLRTSLKSTEIWEDQWTKNTEKQLSRYLKILQTNQIETLPNRKQRALRVAKYILEKKILKESGEKKYMMKELLTFFYPSDDQVDYGIDYYKFAQQWIELFKPYIHRKRLKYPKKCISLNRLKRDYKEIEFSEKILNSLLENIPYTPPPWKNIVACILGVPRK